MQPNGNMLMITRASAEPPALSSQAKQNRRRSARVPRLEATCLEITDAWLNDSQELSLAEATRTMRVNIETTVRRTILEIVPESRDKIRRALSARRQQLLKPEMKVAA